MALIDGYRFSIGTLGIWEETLSTNSIIEAPKVVDILYLMIHLGVTGDIDG
jgi:hypothetical protein